MGTLNTNEKTIVSITKEKSPSPMRSLTLLPTFRGKNNRFFILTKFKFVILSIVSKRKTLKISKSHQVIFFFYFFFSF